MTRHLDEHQKLLHPIDRVVYKSSSYTMTPRDAVVVVTGTATITLPPVKEMAGKMVTIRDDGAKRSITIAAGSDALGFSGAGDTGIDVANGFITFYSDGFSWQAISSYAS